MKKIIVIILSLLIVLYFTFSSEKTTYIEGKFFDCNSKPLNNETITVSLFKDFKDIENNIPIKSKTFKNLNYFKINTSDLKINNFFLLAYTNGSSKIINPTNSTLLNDWSKSISTKNMYKNLYLCNINNTTNPYTASKFSNIDLNTDKDPQVAKHENINTFNENPNENKEEQKEENGLYLYKINGTLDESYFKEICLNNTNIVTIVEVYDEAINNFFPTRKHFYSLKTKKPLSSVLMYCSEHNFELSFFTNTEEIYPYLSFKTIDQDSKKIIYYGVANDINGVPITLLSRKKNNTPTILKPNINIKKDFSTLIINTNKSGLIAQILNFDKIISNTNINKAYLSSSDGKVLIENLPSNSYFTVLVIDPQSLNTLSFDVYTEFPIHNIKIPDVFNMKTSLTIIYGSEFSSISSLSKEPKNKFDLNLKNYYKTINNLEDEKLFVNFRDKNKRSSTELLNLKNNLIIEPEIQSLQTLRGTISFVDNNSLTPCTNCTISFLKNNTKTYSNGNYNLEFNELLTKPTLEFDVNNFYFVNTMLPKNLNILKLDLVLPSKAYLKYLNSISATRKNNATIFGKSDNTILLVGEKTSVKANMLSNGYFYFPDISIGAYTLFFTKDNILTHIRNINIKNTGVYIVN